MLCRLIPGLFLAGFLFTALLPSNPAGPSPAHAQQGVPDDIYEIVEIFIRDSYLTNWFASRENIRRSFMDPMNYYWGKRNVPLRNVIRDKLAYVRRWPRRTFRMINGSLQIQRDPERDSVFAVRFRYEYVTARPGGRSAGLGETTLLLDLGTPDILILGEGGRVLERY